LPLAQHYVILTYPFRHHLSGGERRDRLLQLQGRWQPWWQRLDEPQTARALDDTCFFLPYVRELFFPEAASLPLIAGAQQAAAAQHQQTVRTVRGLGLPQIAEQVPAESVLRLTCTPEYLGPLKELRLQFERKGPDDSVAEKFDAPFEVCWIDAVLFPGNVGFLLLKVRLSEAAPTVELLNDFLYYLRLVHPPTLGWQLASWRGRTDGPSWQARDLIDFLLQGLTEMPDSGHVSLERWLQDAQAAAPHRRWTTTVDSQILGSVFHLYTYACLGAVLTSGAQQAAAGGSDGLFDSAAERALYELATCTDTRQPDYRPHRAHLADLWQHHRAAFWDNWQGLILRDNVVFLGMGPSPFLLNSLAHNIESDYLHLYLFALFQNAWLSRSFGDMILPKFHWSWRLWRLPGEWWRTRRALPRLLNGFHLFQNRYWFPELTRKPQPAELYRLYQHGLGVSPLYEEVAKQIKDLQSVMQERSSRQMQQLASAATFVGWPLSVLATLLGFAAMTQGLFQWPVLLGIGILYGLVLLFWFLISRE
jgi:hypothetical protein